MKFKNKLLLYFTFIISVTPALSQANNLNPKFPSENNMNTTQKEKSPVQKFIEKNDNILFYMEEAIKQNDVNHDDYLALFTRWGEIKTILREFARNPKKYDQTLVADFKEQEELFSDYVKTVYTMLVNESAILNKLNFRFDVENKNLIIMVPQATEIVASEFKRSNYLSPSSTKFKEIVELGFQEVKITDGKKTISLVKTPN